DLFSSFFFSTRRSSDLISFIRTSFYCLHYTERTLHETQPYLTKTLNLAETLQSFALYCIKQIQSLQKHERKDRNENTTRSYCGRSEEHTSELQSRFDLV